MNAHMTPTKSASHAISRPEFPLGGALPPERGARRLVPDPPRGEKRRGETTAFVLVSNRDS